MKKSIQIREWIKKNLLFFLFLVIMAVYYGIHMFTLKPWYDELYTYYYFVSRGPVYAAIHWPVPNNHVLYSVLSAFLDYLGNPYIGLRGISYLASLFNLVLIYRLAGKFMKKKLAAGVSFLYAAVYLTNSLSIQGRGYTLATVCYLIALLSLYAICMEKERKRNYILFAISLAAGLYTLISSTFWVLPVCFIGGIYLLTQKEYGKLLKLIGASLCAAVMTFFLYAVIWLAIGSNLLSKNAESIYYGIYQVTIILKNPLAALTTGMDYMLSTPYVQSIGRGEVVRELIFYLRDLFNLYFQNMGMAITILLIITCVITFCLGVKSLRQQNQKEVETENNRNTYFICTYLWGSIIFLPVMLVIQSVQPYKRVFSFFAVVVSMGMVYIISLFIKNLKKEENRKRCIILTEGLLLLFAAVMLFSGSYNMPYADRENRIAEIIPKEDAATIQNMYYTDDYQKYVLKFYYDVTPNETALEEADTVLVAKELYDQEYEQPQWPILISSEMLDVSYMEENFTIRRESDAYVLYQRKN